MSATHTLFDEINAQRAPSTIVEFFNTRGAPAMDAMKVRVPNPETIKYLMNYVKKEIKHDDSKPIYFYLKSAQLQPSPDDCIADLAAVLNTNHIRFEYSYVPLYS